MLFSLGFPRYPSHLPYPITDPIAVSGGVLDKPFDLNECLSRNEGEMFGATEAGQRSWDL